ncbi:hypothetical protein BDY24DRAFT_419080 [Mrakia frigida]|uniref:uncharacterized protein n=1 Tax=Mrakia frigida TaxID=29902 RepID=UPI003FCC01A5
MVPSPLPLHPFPAIPTEIETHILSLCDQATLAKCSTLSLAFLQLSSPLLYEDVVLYGIESIRKLLCARPDPSYQSHLYPYLALTQIKHLSIFFEEGDGPRPWTNDPESDPIHFTKDRCPSSNPPLPLRSLSILLPMHNPIYTNRRLDQLLALCDPTSFHLKGYGASDASLPDFDCFRLEWKRIKLFTLERAIWHYALSFVLSRSAKFSFEVRYDLSSLKVGSQLGHESAHASLQGLDSGLPFSSYLGLHSHPKPAIFAGSL